MELLLAFACLLLAGTIIWILGSDFLRGRAVMTTRTFFLCGLFIFQVTSAGLSFASGEYGDFAPAQPARSGLIYMLLLVGFFAGFLAIYHHGWFRFGIHKRFPTRFPSPSAKTLVWLAFVLMIGSIIFRFGLIYIPVFNILALLIAPALASAACGTVCWAWSRHMTSPGFILAAATIISSAFIIAVYQQFGRRDASSVLLACVWGAFHGGLKFIDWKRAAIPMTVLAGGAIIVVAALTSTRTEKALTSTLGQTLSRLPDANIKQGLFDIFTGQQAGPNSMWIIENRPGSMPFDTLHSAYYCVTMALPRSIWDQYITTPKPLALALTVVPEAGITRKSAGYNIGPGLVGHFWHDNPLVAFPLYTIAIAVLIRLLDDRASVLPDNPFAVIPSGVALGEIIALPRGELGLFFFRTVLAVVTVTIAMRIFAKILASSGVEMQSRDGSFAPAATDQHDLVDQDAGLAYVGETYEPDHPDAPARSGG